MTQWAKNRTFYTYIIYSQQGSISSCDEYSRGSHVLTAAKLSDIQHGGVRSCLRVYDNTYLAYPCLYFHKSSNWKADAWLAICCSCMLERTMCLLTFRYAIKKCGFKCRKLYYVPQILQLPATEQATSSFSNVINKTPFESRLFAKDIIVRGSGIKYLQQVWKTLLYLTD